MKNMQIGAVTIGTEEPSGQNFCRCTAGRETGGDEQDKRRHDGLIAQRGDTVDPGPDSNFSIWSAGGYIFGYDEIDTTMEVEETVEAREQTVEWEMRQLGIMDWITNDVDWMTGDVRADVKRLAWHN